MVSENLQDLLKHAKHRLVSLCLSSRQQYLGVRGFSQLVPELLRRRMAAPLVDLVSRPAMYSPKVESSLCMGASLSPLLRLPPFTPTDPTVSLPAASIQFVGSGNLKLWFKRLVSFGWIYKLDMLHILQNLVRSICDILLSAKQRPD